MSVKEVVQALGSWGIALKPETPRELIREIEQNKFGHIAIIPGRIDPRLYNDGLLRKARYVGVYRSIFKQADDTVEIKGVGMNFWLGDEDDKGAVIETPVVIENKTFPDAIRMLIPDSVQEGNLYSIPGAGTYTNTHQWETPRKAITYITETYTTSAPFSGVDRIVEFRVNGDGTLDAGPIENLYNTTPRAILVKKDTGRDMRLLGLQADMSMDYDVEDLTTRVVLLAQGEGASIPTGTADAPPTGFVDLFGNPIKMTRLVSESGTPSGNANVRAQVALTRWSLPRQAIQIRTQEFDIKGDFQCGDYIYVFDPEAGFYDLNNEVFWRGQPINPIALRVKEMDWGVRPGWTVAFRKGNGEWLDLSEYYKPESGGSTLAVGDYRRTLAGNNYEPISFRPNLPEPGTDTTIPAAPTWDSFSTGSYQPENGEWTKAAVFASWFQPNNQDGSVITDGGHYEIRYRTTNWIGYQVKWGRLSGHSRLWADDFSRVSTDTFGLTYTYAGGTTTAYQTDGEKAAMIIDALNSSRTAYLPSISVADARIVGAVIPDFVPTGGTYRLGYVLRRNLDGSQLLCMELRFNTDSTVDLIFAKIGTGGGDIATYTGVSTFTPGQKFWVEFEAVGADIRGRAWKDGGSRPAWQIQATESSITSAGNPGMRSVLSATMTNPLPVTGYYDDFVITSLDTTNGYKWGELPPNKWGAPITDPVNTSGEWNVAYVGWGQTQTMIPELTPGIQYEFQIRAADKTNNVSPWSTSEFVTASDDLFAPDTPAAPVVASSRIAIQVVHFLGKASGGTFNLPPDIVYLSVHVGGSNSFLADDSNMVGKLIANSGMIQANIPAVGTFQIEQTDDVWVKVIAVDRAGNKSGASDAVQASVDLIDDAHISDLTVSKVTAGTIMATWLMAGAIKTAESGARVEMSSTGIQAYDSSGNKTVDIKSSDGSVTVTGTIQTLASGKGVSLIPGSIPKIQLTPNDAYTHHGELFAWKDSGVPSGGGLTTELSVRNASNNIDGGKVLLWQDAAVFSHQPDGAKETYVGLNYPFADSLTLVAGEASRGFTASDIFMVGKFGMFAAWDANQAVFTIGNDNIGTGPVIQSYSYGMTMSRVLCPIASSRTSSDTMVRVASATTTGFSIGCSSTSTHTLNIWCIAV